jgi:hypothetical protein
VYLYFVFWILVNVFLVILEKFLNKLFFGIIHNWCSLLEVQSPPDFQLIVSKLTKLTLFWQFFCSLLSFFTTNYEKYIFFWRFSIQYFQKRHPHWFFSQILPWTTSNLCYFFHFIFHSNSLFVVKVLSTVQNLT